MYIGVSYLLERRSDVRTHHVTLDRQEVRNAESPINDEPPPPDYSSSLVADIKQSSSSVEDTGVDYPPETGSFYNALLNVTFCEFDKDRITDQRWLVLAVNATTVTTERAWCPRLGDRPAFEESSFFTGVYFRYMPDGAEKKLAPTRVFDPFRMVEFSRVRRQQLLRKIRVLRCAPDVSGCGNSKYGSYCKSWLSSPICFGLMKKSDGSVCFQPTDSSCVGDAIPCDTVSTPPVTTKAAVSTTTTKAAVSTTTTKAAVSTTTTKAAVSTTTTKAAVSTTTTKAAVSTTTTKAAVSTTTEATTTTAAPTSVTTGEVTTTTTTTMPPTTTTVATTQAITSTTTTTSTEGFGGKYCGDLYGQSFSVDFEEGRATVSVLGQSAGADYEVEGTKIVFSNYDPMLQKLMNAFHIKGIDGTIISPTEVHIKAGFLIDTTLTSC
ncbi:hypothetical protein FOZ60_009341 [Perkinsus olseni]|uniref:Uncharacterized protein n=1 Tax=Perkinsus olseni TaxID=32597 RepID=A0A7J6NIR2_PEROL|nr:hypothetical protein FOZ60_009341 [Perkinsus olseni]